MLLASDPVGSVSTAQSTSLTSGYVGFVYCGTYSAAYFRAQSANDLINNKYSITGCDLWVYQGTMRTLQAHTTTHFNTTSH